MGRSEPIVMMRAGVLIVTGVLAGFSISSTAAQEPEAGFTPITALFRQLLAAPETEQQALASKPVEVREVLVAKLAEYRKIPAMERDRRLRLLDLRWYITKLRDRSPAERAQFLRQIPKADRQLVEARLAIWDSLDQNTKGEVLSYDVARAYLFAQPLPPPPPSAAFQTQVQARLDEAVRLWRELPEDQQINIVKHFNQIFEDEPPLPPGLADVERRQRIQTLQSLKQLEPAERKKCVEGFGRFASLPAAERERFLSKAHLWTTLTARERDTLATLAEQIPPLPPGYASVPPPR